MTFLPFKPIIVHLKKVIRLHIGRNASEGSYKLVIPTRAGRAGGRSCSREATISSFIVIRAVSRENINTNISQCLNTQQSSAAAARLAAC